MELHMYKYFWSGFYDFLSFLIGTYSICSCYSLFFHPFLWPLNIWFISPFVNPYFLCFATFGCCHPCYDFDLSGNGSIAALEKVVHMSEPSTLAGFLSGFRYTSPPLAGGFLVFIYMLVATSRPYRHLVALEVKIIGIWSWPSTFNFNSKSCSTWGRKGLGGGGV